MTVGKRINHLSRDKVNIRRQQLDHSPAGIANLKHSITSSLLPIVQGSNFTGTSYDKLMMTTTGKSPGVWRSFAPVETNSRQNSTRALSSIDQVGATTFSSNFRKNLDLQHVVSQTMIPTKAVQQSTTNQANLRKKQNLEALLHYT